MPELSQLGVGAIFAILILREVFTFLKSKKDVPPQIVQLSPEIENSITSMSSKVGRLHDLRHDIQRSLRQTSDLYELHNVKDQDGAPIWYSKPSLEKVIEKLADNIQTWNTVMVKVADKLEQSDRDHENIGKKLDRLLLRGE